MQAQVTSQNKMKNYGKRVMNNRFFLTFLLLLLSACAPTYHEYSPAPLNTTQATKNYETQDINAPALNAWLKEQGQPADEWPKPIWDIENLVLAGEFFSTALQVESAKVAVAQASEITADQKLNPEIAISSEYHSDRDSGISPWTLGAIFSWVYEDPKKHQTRVTYAQAVTEMTKLTAAEVKWQIRDNIIDSYLDVLMAIHQRNMLVEETSILQSALNILERSLSLGQISEFEVSSTRLALQQSHLAISEIERVQTAARTQLALAVGLPANAMLNTSLDSRFIAQLPNIDTDKLALNNLQAHAVIERPDIQRALAEYVVAEADLHREVAKQYPDLTFSPGFIFDQSDNIWALANSFILPINDVYSGPIGEAEARRTLKAQEVLALQSSILQQIHQARIMYQSALKSLKNSDNLLDAVATQQATLQRQYDLGFTDSLKLIWHQREVLVMQRSRYLLEVTAWREFARLEDATMTRLN